MLAATPTRLTRLLPAALVVFYGCSDPSAPVGPRIEPRVHALAAPVIMVTNTDDAGAGSLRQAIFDALSTNGTVIQFDASLAGKTIALASQLKIGTELTIEGPVSGGITISGNLMSEVFEIIDGNVTLRNLSIVNGRNSTEGGGIFIPRGSVTLDHSLVANNEAGLFGGGIFVDDQGELVVVNSTISANVAALNGGGISGSGTITIRNSTITANSAATGGGIRMNDGRVSIRNTIIANNTDTDATNGTHNNCDLDTGVTTLFTGRNLSDDDSCGTDPTMIVGSASLLPLASNGGPTKTHAILASSDALDRGTLCSEATDQRYVTRNQGTSCDIGAFEFNDYGTFAFKVGPDIAVNKRTGVATVTGTIACSKLGFATAVVTLSQTLTTKGKFTTIVEGSGGLNVASCDAVPSSWTVAITPVAGAFENGTATATVKLVTIPLNFLRSDAAATVKLYNVK